MRRIVTMQQAPEPLPTEGSKEKVPLYIVDDDLAVARTVARAAQGEEFEPRIFGSAGEFLESLSELAPGCILLDVRMPGMTGLELLDELKERRPELPVVMLTGYAEVGTAVHSFRSGAVHFLKKPFKKAELLEALRECAEVGAKRQKIAASREELKALEKLSKREREILSAIAEGKQSKAIAWELGISVRTVDLHRSNILAKLGARNTSQAVGLAKAGGLLDEEELGTGQLAAAKRE
jgi:two-component system response regulator FixJ